MSDVATLVERARERDESAFGELVRRFQDMAVGYAMARTRDRHRAEDAAQEAFLEAYLHLDQLREPAAFPGWFRRIVFKQTDRVTRRRNLEVDLMERAEREPDPAPLPLEQVEQGEVRDQLRAALDALPEREREAVVLHYLGGYRLQEIGEFLDVPESTVKKRLFNARQRLRELLMDAVADSLRESRPSRDDTFAARLLDLLAAARGGDAKRVRELLRSDRALLAARDWLGNSALVVAVNSGHAAIADLLYRAGVRPDLHEASAIGNSVRAGELLSEAAERVNEFSTEGFTPLALAAHYGHVETTRLLLDRGADPDLVSRHPLEVAPIHAALFGGRVETARLLIERGADVRRARGGAAFPRAGWTALHYAASRGFTELIEFLHARGADLDARDAEGGTPLDAARHAGRVEAEATLRRLGARGVTDHP